VAARRDLDPRIGKAVVARTKAALDCDLTGIHGVIDGDGETYERLEAAFEAPRVAGQTQQWKAYCIENLLVQVGWPPEWGAEPDWRSVLADYIPHSALNRVRYQLVEYEKTVGISGYDNPVAGKPLKTREEVLARLAQYAATPNMIDLVATYERELTLCEQALATSLSHAHALVNGKWFIQEYAVRRTGQGKEKCRRTWTDHVASVGGHPEVRAWWERFRAN
jgi:hypothetical protein